MRTLAVVSLLLLSAAACGNAAEEGAKEAKREADLERAKQVSTIKASDRIKPPVAQGTRLRCDQLMDPPAYTEALGELDPLTVRDSTGTMIDSTASCSLIRGGARPDAKAQAALIKKNGRLGVIPGDELCNVTLYCWIVEDEAKFKSRCVPSASEPKSPDADSTGGFACKDTRPQGEFDIDSFKFYDTDTKCVIGVRGGPSFTDNEKIAACARVARNTIGADNIKADSPARYAEPGPETAPTTP